MGLSHHIGIGNKMAAAYIHANLAGKINGIARAYGLTVWTYWTWGIFRKNSFSHGLWCIFVLT